MEDCKNKNGKLLIFIGTMQSGGAERVISVLSSYFVKKFEEVRILTFYKAPLFYTLDSAIKVDCLETLTKSNTLCNRIITFRKYVNEYSPSIILSFLLPFNIFATFSLIGIKKRIIVADRSDPRIEGKNLLRRIFRCISYNVLAHKVIFQTNSNKNYFSKKVQNKSYVIPNPIFIASENIGIAITSEKAKEIVAVGRLTPAKNHILLIDAFKEISKKYNEYVLNIYGNGELYGYLKNYIITEGLVNKVFLKGNTTNVVESIRRSSLYILSSDYEGMPNSLLEAMAIGLPVITTNVSGANEIILDHSNGILIKCGSKNDLIKAMDDLLEDSSLREKLAINAVDVVDKYKLSKIIEKWNDVFQNILSTKKK